MKIIVAIVLALVMVMVFATVSMAGWDKCKGCHVDTGKPFEIGGKTVLTKTALLKKFKTTADFKKAAKDAQNPIMNAFKGDADLDASAKDLGLK